MGEIARELRQLQNDWKKSKAKKRGTMLPEGKYTVKCIESKIARSKQQQRLQHEMMLQVISPKKYKGKTVPRWTGLDNEGSMSWFKAEMKTLGLRLPKKIVNISRIIDECVDLVFEIEIKKNGDYTNIYINELVEEEDLDTEKDEELDEDEDEDEEEDE